MSYPVIAPSTKAPTSPSSTSLADESQKPSPGSSKKCRKPDAKAPSKRGSDGRRRKSEKLHRRSRSGCYTCRLRRKKCEEGKPACRACRNLNLKCDYNRPSWWGNNDQRKAQKEFVKDLIKATKLNEKSIATSFGARSQSRALTPPSLSHSVPTPDTFGEGVCHTREGSVEPKYATIDSEFSQVYTDPYDPFQSQLETPHFGSTPLWTSGAPYEVDIKTEREVFVNDVPTRRDSSVSTFNTYQPPLSHATLPAFTDDDWINPDFAGVNKNATGVAEIPGYNSLEFSRLPSYIPSVHVDECDRHLLDHFFDKTIQLIFPVLEARQQGTVRSDIIVPAIESNKIYLHCCLSVAVVHKKVTQGITGDQVDNDILRHRYQTVSELCKTLNEDTDYARTLEATLALISFQCAVGLPDDALPDISWHQHFESATSLIHQLDLPKQLIEPEKAGMHLPPFDMTLFAWVDILGSTMLGKMPQFAPAYRTKLFNGSGCGFSELMGCEDRVMYLISEIACLDALRVEDRVDYMGLCRHVWNLGQQLDSCEVPSELLRNALSETGEVDVQQLARNITALFHVAARIYLCTLVPGYDRNQPNCANLVSRATEILEMIPAGPGGFDCSLVWPILICGASASPDGPLRPVLERRIKLLGDQAAFGSFGRMIRVLQEVWRVSDSEAKLRVDANAMTSAPMDGAGNEIRSPPSPEPSTTSSESVAVAGSEEQQQSMDRSVHWRDVMKRNGWEYLLI